MRANNYSTDGKALIASAIREYVRRYPSEHSVETRWETPLIGIADAEDPLFAELKTIIGPTHALPDDILSGAKSVICVFVPFTRDIIKSNISGDDSSREWDYAYLETNGMLEGLTDYLYRYIVSSGYRSSNMPQTYKYDPEKIRCDWSHRSAAYIAGLGSFGINNMIITEKGCCGRFTSVITDWPLEPDCRNHDEACLFKRNRSCKACVSRCPSGALVTEGDKYHYHLEKCYDYIYSCNLHEWPIGTTDTCGKCLTGLPCSFQRP